MGAGIAEPDLNIRMREIAEQIGTEFRRAMTRVTGVHDAPVYASSELADVFYDLLCSGVIEPGEPVFR